MTLSAGRIGLGSQIDSGASGLKSLALSQWDGGKLIAPWVGAITTKADPKRATPLRGDFGADLQLSGVGAVKTTLGTAKIAGHLSANLWDIAGNLGSLSVAGATVGKSAANPLTVRATGSMKSLSLGAALHADFQAGLTRSVPRHASYFGDFVNATAAISTIAIKGLKSAPGSRFVTDSSFSAASIGSASLVNIDLENNGAEFGLFALYRGKNTGVKSARGADLASRWAWAKPSPCRMRWAPKTGQRSSGTSKSVPSAAHRRKPCRPQEFTKGIQPDLPKEAGSGMRVRSHVSLLP